MPIDKKSQFISKIKNVYAWNYEAVLGELGTTRQPTFRVVKIAGESGIIGSLEAAGYILTETFLSHVYAVKESSHLLSASSAYGAGDIYIQGLSSMLAVHVLDPGENMQIIDLCAAPGSKTLLIFNKTNGRSEITAVENNTSRMYALKNNLRKYGADKVLTRKENAAVLQADPRLLAKYDRVLADVPCSNEGLIRDLDNYDFSHWNFKQAKRLSQLQKKILASGLKLLKPGGTLVYSTCTYSPEENEAVVSWALEKVPSVTLQDISGLHVPYVRGLSGYNGKVFNQEVAKTVRILPSKITDGFFLAKFIKY